MAAFSPELLDLLRSEREIELTTYGRKSGKPATVTIWVVPDDAGRVYVRSGYGMASRDWPRNLAASGRGVVRVAGREVAVRARHVDDLAEARRTSTFIKRKYGDQVQVAAGDDPPTPGEQASFELTPAEA
jgi:deazaflavin-dependent oxidoreductase (nitroreductase family)